MSLTDDLAIVDVWAASAELRIPEVQGEDMHMIAPRRVGWGYRLGMAYSVTDLAFSGTTSAEGRSMTSRRCKNFWRRSSSIEIAAGLGRADSNDHAVFAPDRVDGP